MSLGHRLSEVYTFMGGKFLYNHGLFYRYPVNLFITSLVMTLQKEVFFNLFLISYLRYRLLSKLDFNIFLGIKNNPTEDIR